MVELDPIPPRYDSAGSVPVTAVSAERTASGGSAEYGFHGITVMGGELRSAIGGSGVLAKPKWTISVYIDDGVVFDYDVESISAAREHASAIVSTGYRSVQANAPDTLTHYPPHRITKVKIKAPAAIQSGYYDRVRGT